MRDEKPITLESAHSSILPEIPETTIQRRSGWVYRLGLWVLAESME